MPDRYVTSVVIIFAALLMTIPTYHEMKRAAAQSGYVLAPRPEAEAFAGTPPASRVSRRTVFPARGTNLPGNAQVPRQAPDGQTVTATPGRLGRRLVEVTSSMARGPATPEGRWLESLAQIPGVPQTAPPPDSTAISRRIILAPWPQRDDRAAGTHRDIPTAANA